VSKVIDFELFAHTVTGSNPICFYQDRNVAICSAQARTAVEYQMLLPTIYSTILNKKRSFFVKL
jgi:hypothetical protein